MRAIRRFASFAKSSTMSSILIRDDLSRFIDKVARAPSLSTSMTLRKYFLTRFIQENDLSFSAVATGITPAIRKAV